MSLRRSITMTNPMLAASTLQKRVVSIRDQVRHMGSGGSLTRTFYSLWHSGLMCKHAAWHRGKSDFPNKRTNFLSSSWPGSLNKTEILGVSNPPKGSVYGWQVSETPKEYTCSYLEENAHVS